MSQLQNLVAEAASLGGRPDIPHPAGSIDNESGFESRSTS
jgi:hypothetical protein